MEYVARRKLTQAAEELLFTSRRVCDIAMEYGFESREVFTRAFKKMWQGNRRQYLEKSNVLASFFPRQDFSATTAACSGDASILEDMRKMLECREHTWVVCFDMEAPGIRCHETAFGRGRGERFVLDCPQRIRTGNENGGSSVSHCGG